LMCGRVRQHRFGGEPKLPRPLPNCDGDDMGRDDVNSKKRAGRRVRQKLRAEAWAATRKNGWRLTGFLVAYLTFCAVAVTLYHRWGHPSFGWFLGGLLVGLLPFYFSTFLLTRGIAQRQVGGDAEAWTAEELEALDRRVWRVFHDVPVRYGNVDHVAVGPGRVYAIETKWTSAGVRYLDQQAACAERQARRLQEELRARGNARDVVPLLVVWGPKLANELGEQPRKIGEARVVAGRHSSVWLQRMVGAADRLEIDIPAARTIETLIREEGSEPPPPPSREAARP
jgi:hypothetical protein